jgi:ABC-type phosphate transport system permease subunit
MNMKGRFSPGNLGDRTFGFVLRFFSWATIALFVGMLVFLARLSWEAIETYGAKFWAGVEWNPPMEEFGAAPFIVGTLASSLIAVLIAAPVSVGTAVFLREIAPRKLSNLVAFLVELLAAIPSVVYGLWGVFVLAPVMRDQVQPFLATWFGPDTYFASALGHLATALLYPFSLIGNLLGRVADLALRALQQNDVNHPWSVRRSATWAWATYLRSCVSDYDHPNCHGSFS